MRAPGVWVAECPTIGGVRDKRYWRITGGEGFFPHGFEMTGFIAPKDALIMSSGMSLLTVLTELVERCDGEEGVRADGSNIDTRRAHYLLELIRQAVEAAEALPGPGMEDPL